jgi:hypothetical protein
VVENGMKTTWNCFISLSLLLLAGCGASEQDTEAEAIKACYTEFRTAVVNQDTSQASKCVASKYLEIHAVSEILHSFNSVTQSNMEITRSRVIFDGRSKAWIYPQRTATLGYAFIKETNGWKITTDVRPIVD